MEQLKGVLTNLFVYLPISGHLVQNAHEDIWYMPKGPCNLVLSTMPMFRKHPWVQIVHNVYLYFWFIGLIHKKIMSCFIGPVIVCG